MVWHIDDPQGNEAGKVKHLVVPYTRGRGLDLGCGPWKAFPHFTGVDSGKDTELYGIEMKPDVVVETCEDLPYKDASQDFVFSSHLLEHIADHKAALAEWWRVIKVGGHLCLYLPHADLYPRIGEEGSNPDHKHDFVNADIEAAMREIGERELGWDLLVDEVRAMGREYSFLQVYRKRADGQMTCPAHDPRPEKTACVVRYGAFGDCIQTANILPPLKRQGFHVTVMTTPKGYEILKHDPHIDDWIIQDKDQVPNQELTRYWEMWSERFDRFVNLSESIEGTLLAIPGRANHRWPDNLRRRELNRNYLEWTAELAQVPLTTDSRFYPSPEEEAWADLYRSERMGDGFAIMWALAGSSVHKFYPWQDAVIARVLAEIPGARFVLVGDDACKLLEQGWEKEPRVLCESGNLGIRQTLALARVMDCVVGPETGVLNSVAFEFDIAKVCLLSHSTVKNLTRDWRNTKSMVPPETVGCYPCHRLHYTRDYCWEHVESGAAMCQAAIDPDNVFSAINDAHTYWRFQREARRVA